MTAASASRSAWVIGGFLDASSCLAFFSILSTSFLRLSSSETIFSWSCCLLILVVERSEARVGKSAADGSQLVRSDFFFGLGGRATGCSMRTFFLNFAGMASWALRLRSAVRFSRAWRSSSFSPSSSSALSSLSSSSEDESIKTSESSGASSVKPASSSSSAKSSSRSESSAAGSSLASIDFIRFPAVDRFARDVASHSTSCGSSASLSPSLLLVIPMSDRSPREDDFLSSSSVAMAASC
jgi:hypothetical protein